MLQAQANMGLPDVIRVKALKGFRALTKDNNQFTIVRPGDVVEVDRQLAMELRMHRKAVMVNEELKRQTDADVIAAKQAKRQTIPSDPVAAQMATMAAAFERMTKAFEAMASTAPAKKA